MYKRQNTEENCFPPIVSTSPTCVKTVEALDDFQLVVEFMDGLKGTVFIAELVANPDAGVFTALKDVELFKQVYVLYGAVTWPGEIDLAPDAMYDEFKKNGKWVLR